MKTSTVAQMAVCGYALLIIGVSSIPSHSMPVAPELWRWDKLIHSIEYGVAATLLYWVLYLWKPHAPKVRFFLCLLAVSAFGVVDELYQSTVPGRHSSIYDVLADWVGASFATIACAVFYSRHRVQEEEHRVDHT